MAGKQDVVIPSSKLKVNIAKILKDSGYIKEFSETGELKKELKVKLFYKNNKPAIESIKRVSKPGQRVYRSADNLPRVLNGYGIAIVSTSKGIMTNQEARKQKVGGEIICEVY